MKHLATLIVGIVSYVLFLVAALYGVSFTLGGLLPDPVSISHAPPVLALLVDMGLVLIFGIQHSVMARSGWKERWTPLSLCPGAQSLCADRQLHPLGDVLVLATDFQCTLADQ